MRSHPVSRLLGPVAAGLFSLGLGMTGVVVPLIALDGGFSASEVGVLVALAAVSQLAARLTLGWLLSKVPDRGLVAAAGASLALANLILLLPTSWGSMSASLLLQGLARALFWTASQTHAVRSAASAVGGLALINFAAGVGQTIGPVVAGLLLTRSSDWAVLIAAVVGTVVVVPALGMQRFAPFNPPRRQRGERPSALTRHRVRAAGWASAVAGSWRALLGSYVPVVLVAYDQSAPRVGFLVAASSAVAILGSLVSGAVNERSVGRILVVGTIMTGSGMVGLAGVAGHVTYAAIVLAVAGLGAGMIQTVAPAVASAVADPEERGRSIASAGAYRAASQLLTPFAMAGMVTVASVSLSLGAVGLLMTFPGWIVHRSMGDRLGPPD